MPNNQMIITGQVVFEHNSLPVPAIKVELWDAQNEYGLLGTAFSQLDGSINFYLNDPISDLIGSNTIVPLYKTFHGEVNIANSVSTQGGLVITITESNYDSEVKPIEIDKPVSYISIHGRVTDAYGNAIPSLTVNVYEQGFRATTLLSQTQTKLNGDYWVRVNVKDLGNSSVLAKRGIIVKVVDNSLPIAESSVLYVTDASEMSVNLTIQSETYSPPSKFETLIQKISYVLDGVTFEDFAENVVFSPAAPHLDPNSEVVGLEPNQNGGFDGDSNGELSYIARAAGEDIRVIQEVVMAYQLANELGVDHDLVYALSSRSELGLDPLLSIKDTDITLALNSAIAANIIPSHNAQEIQDFVLVARDHQINATKDTPIVNETHTISNVLEAIFGGQNAEAEATDFLDKYYHDYVDSDAFWQYYSSVDPSKAEKAERGLRIATMTGFQPEMISSLMTDTQDGLHFLAPWTQNDWLQRINQVCQQAGKLCVPAPIIEISTDDTHAKTLYSQKLLSLAQDEYPLTALNVLLQDGQVGPTIVADSDIRAQVIDFIADNPQFDLRVSSIYDINEQNQSLDLSNVQDLEDVQQAMAPMQRMLRLVGGNPNAVAGLIAGGLGSYASIAASSPDDFASTYGSLLGGPDPALGAFAKATALSATATATLTAMQQVNLQHNPFVINYPYQHSQQSHADPNIATMFGNASYCACEQCLSVYSPAAYFTDIMNFLKTGLPSSSAPSVYAELIRRRPDLPHIDMTCKNTNTLMPYIDLVIELLEGIILRRFSQPTVVVPPSFQTSGTPKELAAHPEHVYKHVIASTPTYSWEYLDYPDYVKVYDTPAVPNHKNLTNVVYPFNLPFSLPAEETRSYLGYLGYSRYQAMKMFQPYTSASPTIPDFAIYAEFLGLTVEEAKIVTGTHTLSASRWLFYGFASASVSNIIDPSDTSAPLLSGTWSTLLTERLDLLVQQLKMSYKEFLQFLTSDFLNKPVSGTREITVTAKAGSPPDTCDLTKLKLVFTGSATAVAFLGKLHRFVRLWNTKRMSVSDWDKLFTSLLITSLNETDFELIGRVLQLSEKLRLKLTDLTGWWWYTDIHQYVDYNSELQSKQPSTYDLLYRNRAVLNLPLPEFHDLGGMDPTSIPLGELPSQYNGFTAAIAAANNIAETDLLLILDYMGITDFFTHDVTLGELSNIYFFANLSKKTGYSVSDLIKLLYLLEIDIELPVSSQSLIGGRLDELDQILSAIEAIRASAFTFTELVYLVENFDENGPSAPAPITVQLFWEKLRNELKKFPLYVGAIPPVAPTDPDEDITAYNQLINIIYQHFSKEFNIPSEWVAVGIASLDVTTTPVQSLISFLISEDFVNSDEPLTPDEPTISALLYPIYKRVYKWAMITLKFRLNLSEFSYLFQQPLVINFDFTLLPDTGISSGPLLGTQFKGLLQMSRWVTVRDRLSLIEDQLVRLLKAASDDASDVNISMAAWQGIINREKWGNMLVELIGDPTTIVASTPAGLLNARFPEDFTPANASSISKLWGMISIMAACLRTGLQPVTLQTTLLQSVTMADSHQVILAAKGKHTEDEWAAIAKPLRDTLRKKQRDALVGFVVANPQPTATSVEKWRNENDLYAFLLIDVEMEACMKTSRIKQAICSVQLYVDRVLLGLEYINGNVLSRINLPAKMQYQWDQWRSWYRIWEANRKVFLYPENWIEPELRDDKSVFFTEMEDKLFQGDVTKLRAEDALWEYLRKLDEVSNLEPMAVCDAKDPVTGNIIVHVVARTFTEPHKYYYRRLVYNQWTPWERMDIEIKGNHLSMIYSNDRLYLFWITMLERQVPGRKAIVNNVVANDGYGNSKWFYNDLSRGNSDTTLNDSSPVYIQQVEITVNWSVQKENQWQAQEIGKEKAYIDINPIAHQYYQKLFADPGGSPTSSLSPSSVAGAHFMQKYYRLVTKDRAKGLMEMIMSRIYFQTFTANEKIGLLINTCINYDTDRENADNIHLFWFTRDQGVKVWDLWSGARIPAFPWTAFIDNKCVNGYKNFETPPAEYLWEALAINNNISFKASYYCYLAECMYTYDRYCGRDGMPKYVLNKSPNGRYTVFGFSDVWNNSFNITQKGFFYNDEKYGYFARAVQIPPSGSISLAAAAERGAQIYYRQSSTPYTTVFGAGAMTTAGVPGYGKFYFQSFFHGRTKDFLKALNGGLDNFMKLQTQNQTDRIQFATKYVPTSYVYNSRYPVDIVDFAYDSAYSVYNWELFFHMPLLIAKRLSDNQQFEEARKWYHYIFDPTCNVGLDGSTISHTKDRFWRFRPFFDAATSMSASVSDLLEQIHAGNAAALEQLNVWMDNPFKPHVIARMRVFAYMKNVVMCYMDNLIAWADKLYRQDTIETVNLATNLYIVVSNILGERPQEVPKRLGTGPRTLQELMDAGLDAFSNAKVAVENYIDPNSGSYTAPSGTGGPIKTDGPPIVHLFYYCLPNNAKMLGYWDTIANRLFNIRNCRNIDGQLRELPLFEPPIDPALLVRAAAAGIDANSVLDDLTSPTMPYKFTVILQKANELCNDVKALGGALLSALEKKDAEELALIRSGQEIAVLESMRTMKKVMIDEAAANIDAMVKSKDVVQARYNYYSTRVYKSPREIEHLMLMDESQKHQNKASNLSAIASVVSIIPELNFQIPFAIGPSFGGRELSAFFSALSTIQAKKAAAKAAEANKTLTEAGYERRRDDWQFQAESATKEMAQIDRQIIAAQIRKSIAEKDLETNELQIENAKAVDEYMHQKYTNLELYSWMVGQISSTYFQVYQFAYDVAKRAEKSLIFEVPWVEAPGGSFIRFGYWDSLKKGLMSGEKMQYDLRKMEMAYLEGNKRELEVTKHISLAFENPEMLLQLRRDGFCEIECTREMLDLDYPGHYLRRVKSVSVSIPCVAGPYTTIAATLTQSGGVIENIGPGGTVSTYPANSSNMIALSGAQNDSGVFELSMRDERYLPFEGSGARCTWILSLMDDVDLRQFDYNTISDVIVHVKYTAQFDSAKAMARTAELKAYIFDGIPSTVELPRYFSLRHEFATAWYAYANAFGTDDQAQMEVTIDAGMFPYLAVGKDITVGKWQVMLKLKAALPGTCRLEVEYEEGVEHVEEIDIDNVSLTGLGEFTPAPIIAPGGYKLFKVKMINETALPDEETININDYVDDIYVVAIYTLSIPTP